MRTTPRPQGPQYRHCLRHVYIHEQMHMNMMAKRSAEYRYDANDANVNLKYAQKPKSENGYR